MKRTLITLLMICFACGEASAQSDTLKKVVDYSVFPIGALRYPDASFLEGMFGMNFNWWGFAGSGSTIPFPIQSQPDTILQSLQDPFRPDTATVHTTSDLLGLLVAASYGMDARVYLPGTSGVTEEYTYGWRNRSGQFLSGTPEWRIGGDTMGLGYVLSDLRGIDGVNSDATVDPYVAGGYGQPSLDPNHVGPFSFELIYRFDSSQILSYPSGTAPLYSLEYWIKKPGDTGFVFYAADTITKYTYGSLPIARTLAQGHDVQAEKLDQWKGMPRDVHYRIQRRLLRIDTFYRYNYSQAPQVDVRLRNFQQIPIFVRLLRIRDWVGQRLLTGKADSILNIAITLLKNREQNGHIGSWTIANEQNYRSFHAWAYVNNLLTHAGAPPSNVLALLQSEDLFMRVVRDQSDYSSGFRAPYLWHEWTTYGGAGFFSRYFHGGVPISYIDTGSNNPRIVPYNMAHDSTEWWKHGVLSSNNYAEFTNRTQGNGQLGYSSEANGGGAGDYQNLVRIAHSAFEMDTAHPIPYFLMAQTIVKPVDQPKWLIDSLQMVFRASVRSAIDTVSGIADKNRYADSAAFHYADSLYAAVIVNPYIARHSGTNNLEEDSIFDLVYANRNPTPAEMYYQLWFGVGGGMRGYALNLAYTDGIDQFGMLSDSNKVARKSKDINCFERRTYQLTDPTNYSPGGSGGFSYDPAFGAPRGYGGTDTFAYYRAFKLTPAYKQLYTIARSLITDELGPIATTLSKLNWNGSVSWHVKDSTPTYLSRLPVRYLHSKTLGGSVDSDAQTYVQCSVFQNPNDSTAKYVCVQNRRLWCDELDTLTTDYRKIAIVIDSTHFLAPYNSIPLWQLTDVSGKLHDTVVTAHDTFSFTLKPGQGKLFRVAPAIGLKLGTMATNYFNNGRHLTAIEGSSISYAATYQNGGNIYVAYPSETPSGLSRRTAGSPADSLVVSDTLLKEYPSIASGPGRLGLVYQTRIPTSNPAIDSIQVWYRYADTTTRYMFSTVVPLDAFSAPKGFNAAPAIAASSDVNYHFWTGWTHPSKGFGLMLVGAGLSPTNQYPLYAPQYFSAGHPTYSRFISLAAHRSAGTSLFMALEEKDQIYFATAHLLVPNIVIDSTQRISPWCKNHHPQIALSKSGVVGVVWEITGTNYSFIPRKTGGPVWGGKLIASNKSMVQYRQRNLGNSWQNLSGFNVLNTPPTVSLDTLLPLPNVAIATKSNNAGSTWWDSLRITWNNPITQLIGLARPLKDPKIRWSTYDLVEPSLEPAMSVLTMKDTVLQPLLYRSPNPDDQGRNVRVTQYDFPITNLTSSTKRTVDLRAVPTPCAVFTARFALPFVAHYGGGSDSTLTIGKGVSALGDSSDSRVGWDDTTLRTEDIALNAGDTLSYERFFRVGEFTPGDTSNASGYLVDSLDYIKARVLIRNSSTRAVVTVLDSAVLTESGFTQTANLLVDSGYRSYVVPSNLGSVYITLELSRGNPLNSFELSETESVGDDPIDAWPPPAPLEKRIGQPMPSTSQQSTDSIRISVVPNPFHNSATITVAVLKDLPLNVTLFDALGRRIREFVNLVADAEQYSFTIDTDGLATGTYYLRGQSGNGVVTRQIKVVR